MKKQSFLYGATVLAAASILCKIMSAALKIPLDRLFLHEAGIGAYQSAYSIYNVILAICVTGIPIALSKLIAESDDKEAASLTKSTFVFVTGASSLLGVLLFIFAEPLARFLSGGGEAVAAPGLRVLAIAFPFMGIISSRRGYFQGKSTMTPSGVSQLAESLAKVIMGIGVCALTYKMGTSYGVAGALSGVSIGAVCAALVLEVAFRRAKAEKGQASLSKAWKVFKFSLPVTLGAFAFTAVMLLDTLSVPQILSRIGVAEAERGKLFGYLTRANTIYNLPATIITAFTASAVPALVYTAENKEKLSETATRVIKLVFLVALPCALGMMLFPQELLLLIYSSTAHWQLMVLVGIMVLIMPYIQTTTAMLQTLGRTWVPIWISLGAIVLKFVLNIVFMNRFGVEGAVLATVTAFLIAAIINTVLLLRVTPLKGGARIVIKLVLCALISCGGAKILYSLTGGTLMLLVSVCLAAVMYLVLVIITKCFSKEEFKRG
ncbi:MAG: polysaccharide biosynthesis protein [Ruminococcaceae bacterium]|nr:polysaccharide biosynthesis protein [Oscillospiraceae bacterium]